MNKNKLALTLLLFCQLIYAQNTHRLLTLPWQFKQTNTNDWLPATVPGCVHLDLLNNKKIEDPYFRNNEKELQWIDRENWEYASNFSLTNEDLKNDHIELTFKGLDTYADVFINDQLVLKADNMYREWVVDIKKWAKEKNAIKVVFYSAVNEGLKKRDILGYDLPAVNDFSEIGGIGTKKVSVFTRKAPYHFGWDWGPRFVTSGIWRPIELHFWNKVQLSDFAISTLDISTGEAKMKASFEIKCDNNGQVELTLSNPLDAKVNFKKTVQLQAGINEIEIPFSIANPKLWWCYGMGNPNLYQFQVQIAQNGKKLDSKTIETGIRKIALIRKQDTKGKSFYFELNGKPVYIKGSNYIPNEVFLTRTTNSQYQSVIDAAKETHQNMLRVWGGGIYEEDLFYQMCDRNGLLVWQDFMFACAMYPGDSAFLQNVEKEVIYNVKRLRNHPSIALWCGNNEMDAMWTYWEVQPNYTEEQRKDIWKSYEKTFYDIIPKQLKKYSPEVPYWSSSPITEEHQRPASGAVKDSAELASGDLHCWAVWFRKGEWNYYDTHVPRFMSEFGAQSFPEMKTIKAFALPEDYAFDSPVMKAHQRSGPGNELINYYIERDYRKPKDFADFVYLSQLVQSESMKIGIEAQRRAKPYNMGVMYWQINDCWPVVSWSSMDYFGRKKALHYTLKNVNAPLLISAVEDKSVLSVKCVTDLPVVNGVVNVELYDLNGKVLNTFTKRYSKMSNETSIDVFSIKTDSLLNGKMRNEVYLKMTFSANAQSVQNLFFFEKMKNYDLHTAKLSYTLEKNNNQYTLKFKADKLVRHVQVDISKQAELSDNYFDILPGQSKTIFIKSKENITKSDIQLNGLNKIE